MKPIFRLFNLLLGLLLLLTACAPKQETLTPTSTADATIAPTPAKQPDIYLNIIWHQHQPFYAVDPETGLVSAPWVRFHAAKDYVDMVSIIEQYPNIHMTVNLTPSLIRQIDAFNAGQRDIVWALTLVPAEQLTDEQKTYILRRFFDINDRIVKRFPRYVELQKKRGGADEASIAAALASWTPQDFRDLQVLFNLAWTDPDFLAQEPLASLVAKGRDYSEADKKTVLDKHAELMAQVLPVHKQFQDKGQIEVTFTPYAHPILPLLIDTNLATQAIPDIQLPAVRFTRGDDAIQHLERGIALYEEKFGRKPRGMWPAEGSVAQLMVGMTARAGVQWMVTDEGILANSLGLDFTRLAGGVPMNATALYRPYTVGKGNETVVIFFRDTVLSNRVSFDYSQMAPQAAVDDFMSRLRAIRDKVKNEPGGPYVVTVILDGENAWEWYENDGKEFLHGLYRELSNDPTIQTVTPSEFLALYNQTPETIPNLWAGSWDSANFATWIGEDEENRAWEYLAQVRADLDPYLKGQKLPADQLEKAYQAMLAAEGSDWFWWYGSDKDSGNDAAFDAGFRETLGQVYDALGLPRPDFLRVPIIQPAPVEPEKALDTTFTPTLDGVLTSRAEWQSAGAFLFEPTLEFGFDKNNLYLNVIGPLTQDVEIYLKAPALLKGQPFTEDGRLVGFYATHRLLLRPNAAPQVMFQAWNEKAKAWNEVGASEPAFTFAWKENVEIAIPLADLQPTLDTGDSLLVRLVTPERVLPVAAPGRLLLPDLGRIAWLITVTDPANDDHGPGTYRYPTDGVFKAGVFDLVEFRVGQDEQNLVFSFRLRGPLENPWGSPNGLALQRFEVYIDVDGPAAGNRLLRNARNAALTPDSAWDYALSIAGWEYGFFTAAAPEKPTSLALNILPNPAKSTVLVKIPLNAIPGDPLTWKYAVAVFSHDGYGINGIRDVTPDGGQWAVGGAPNDKNHTRILDYLWPQGATPSQEEMLSTYKPSQADPASLGADDFPQVKPYVP